MSLRLSDAELLRLCQRLISAEAEFRAVLLTRKTIEDEERTDSELAEIGDRISKTQIAINALLPPHTQTSWLAVGRAALASATGDGVDFGERVALRALGAIIADGLSPTYRPLPQ